jgi:hypothetical protein
MFYASKNLQPAQVFTWQFLPIVRAALLAVDHVNNRDCSVLGPGCEKLVTTTAGNPVRVTPWLADTHDLSPLHNALATQLCTSTDAPVIVGPTTPEQSNLVSSFLTGFGALPRTLCTDAFLPLYCMVPLSLPVPIDLC